MVMANNVRVALYKNDVSQGTIAVPFNVWSWKIYRAKGRLVQDLTEAPARCERAKPSP